MELRDQIRHSIWLNMHGEVQNQLIAPWEIRVLTSQYGESQSGGATMVSTTISIRRTGFPLSLPRLFKMYATWGETEQLVRVLFRLGLCTPSNPEPLRT